MFSSKVLSIKCKKLPKLTKKIIIEYKNTTNKEVSICVWIVCYVESIILNYDMKCPFNIYLSKDLLILWTKLP